MINGTKRCLLRGDQEQRSVVNFLFTHTECELGSFCFSLTKVLRSNSWTSLSVCRQYTKTFIFRFVFQVNTAYAIHNVDLDKSVSPNEYLRGRDKRARDWGKVQGEERRDGLGLFRLHCNILG